MLSIFEAGEPVLNQAHADLHNGKVAEGMDKLMFGLLQLRQLYNLNDWQEFADDYCLEHPIRETLHQSPFTRRSFEQPRGYAGDAPTIDYLYGHAKLDGAVDPCVAKIFDWEMRTPGAVSVRERRDIIARYIDAAAETFTSPDILSIACGHLREAHLSDALQAGLVGKFVALDQDPESLAVIQANDHHNKITTLQASVRAVLQKKVPLQDFHLVYAAGLYDYLTDAVATRLTALMFEMLLPKGRVLVANFAPNLHNIGYMEAYMNWKLIYRDEFAMEQLLAEIPEDAIADYRIFRDSQKNIIYLDVHKR